MLLTTEVGFGDWSRQISQVAGPQIEEVMQAHEETGLVLKQPEVDPLRCRHRESDRRCFNVMHQ